MRRWAGYSLVACAVIVSSARAAAPVRVMVVDEARRALQGAAEVYRRTHPGVRFEFNSSSQWAEQRLAETDALVFVDRSPLSCYASLSKEKVMKSLKASKACDLGWTAGVFVVRPEHKQAGLTWKQVQLLAGTQAAQWNEIGHDDVRWIVRWWSIQPAMLRILTHARWDPPIRPLIPRLQHRVEGYSGSARRAHREKYAHLPKLSTLTGKSSSLSGILARVAESPVALGWVPLTGQVQDSGLKILAVDGVLPTPYSVSQGAYRIRWPVRVLLSSRASAETNAFFKWLGTPQGALAMSEHSVFAPALPKTEKTHRLKPGKLRPNWPRPSDAPAAPTTGRVAILASRSVSGYLAVVNPNVFEAFDRTLVRAIEHGGKFTVIDRNHIDAVLAERLFAIETDGETSPSAFGADILLLPRIVRIDGGPALRIRAHHGTSGSMLGELSFRINPANPTDGLKGLDAQLSTWWPAVVSYQARAKTQPVWIVAPTRSRIGQAMERTLMQRADRVIRKPVPLAEVNQELLLQTMGLIRTEYGSKGLADVVVITRKETSPVPIVVTVLSRATSEKGTVIQEKRFSNPVTAVKWVLSVGARPEGAATSADSLERLAARRLMDHADRLGRNRKHQLAARAEFLAETYRLASLWMPTWEDPAIRSLSRSGHRSSYSQQLYCIRQHEQILAMFPKSKQAPRIMQDVCDGWQRLRYRAKRVQSRDPRWYELPPANLDMAKFEKGCLRKEIYWTRRWLELYLPIPSRKLPSLSRTKGCVTETYVRILRERLGQRDTAWSQCRTSMDEYARIFQTAVLGKTEYLTHPDFLELALYVDRDQKAEFLKKLRAMQKESPNPKDRYWGRSDGIPEEGLGKFFSLESEKKNRFYQWRSHNGPLGGLPYVEYDPQTDKPSREIKKK